MGQNVQQIVENYFSGKKASQAKKISYREFQVIYIQAEVSPSKPFSLISLSVILDNVIFELSLWMMIKE